MVAYDLLILVPLNKWTYAAVTFNVTGNTAQLYANGVATGSAATIGSYTDPDGQSQVGISYNNISVGRFQGALDEVRVSKSIRSADWITTEYNNQSATSTFYTIGSESQITSIIGNSLKIVVKSIKTIIKKGFKLIIK